MITRAWGRERRRDAAGGQGADRGWRHIPNNFRRRAGLVHSGTAGRAKAALAQHRAPVADDVPPPLRYRELIDAGTTRAGLRHHVRRGTQFTPLRGVYAQQSAQTDPLVTLRAALRAIGPAAAYGASAALLHGIALVRQPTRPQVTLLDTTGAWPRHGVRLRTCNLAAGELVVVDGLVTASVPRCLVDLLREADRVTAIWACEDAIRKRLVTIDVLDQSLANAAHQRGIVRARTFRRLLEPRSESPLETAIRLAILDSDLPPPLIQHEIRTDDGHLVAVLDMAYDDVRLGIEGDGRAVHATPEAVYRDRRRANALLLLGWQELRFTWDDATRSRRYIPWAVRRARAEGRLPPR